MARKRAENHDDLGIKPVSTRQTVQEVVYRQLSQALMTGRFNPGQLLTIASLSQLFGTSHMPVREALRRLVAENALDIASTGSAHVPDVSRERLDDLCNARVIVEVACTELATAKLTPRAIRNLEQLANGHIAAGREKSTSEMLSKNQQFHFAVYEAAGSPVLLQLVNTLWLRFGPYLRMLTNHMEAQLETGAIEIYTIHHQHLIAAMKVRDVSSAKRHMELDIRSTQYLLQPICDAQDSLSAVA